MSIFQLKFEVKTDTMCLYVYLAYNKEKWTKLFSEKKKKKKFILTVYPDLALLLTWSRCLRSIVSRDSEEKWWNWLSIIY